MLTPLHFLCNRQLYHWTGLKKLMSLLPICLLVAIAIYYYGDGDEDVDGDGIRVSDGSVAKLQEDFKIHVDGDLIVDSELPAFDKMKYYVLCRSQGMFLHGQLIEGLGSKLVTAMICKTTDIATAIKSLSHVPSLGDLERWDKTLKAFEDLGMNVGFLRTRIDMLAKILHKYHQTVNKSSSAKFAQVEEEKRALNEKVSTMDALQKSIAVLEESIKCLESEIDGEEEGLRFEFSKIASAPW
ncbi:B3 domain-containing protein Os01g0234100-like [Henckelia pumila]|uniref:B3 domain-containing protein Os01g0234100-like n=1 Tax=Henckelia pumila TaxID=405737 RepID=UPI003C6DDEEF